MTPSVQNLNAKLSPRPRPASPRVKATNRHLARQRPLASIRVAPRAGGYRGGGYLIDV